jgi:hypothetical protein
MEVAMSKSVIPAVSSDFNPVNPTTVSWEYSSYNPRRYSKPWGARVTFKGATPSYDFNVSTYLGDDNGGRLVIVCNPGDIVARGQRDTRQAKKTENIWYVINADGTATEVSRTAAYDHWQAAQSAG